MSRVKDVDKGYAALVKRVYGMGAPKVDVGIFDSGATEPDGMTVLEVAIVHEFGSDARGIPERSFLRAWFDENSDNCRAAMAAMMQAVLEGKYAKDQAIELLAQRFVAEIQKRIAQGIPPPNAPATIAAKGSATPLIDTGQLRSSISYKVK